MELSLQIPFTPHHLDVVERLGLEAVQLRVGPGFPIETGDPGLLEARSAARELSKRKITVPALGFYRNLLDADAEVAADDAARFQNVLAMAEVFGAGVIGVFAGRDPDQTIEESIGRWADVWGPLAEKARKVGVTIAFENCTMFRGYPVRGINLSHTPHAYELMFRALPFENIGIEFDPSHLHKQMIDPVRFLRQFADRIFHVHAKDHERLPEELHQYGCFDVRASRDRFPGRGQIDFQAIFAELRRQNYAGAVTIEGERDPDFKSPEEIERGLLGAVKFLRIAMSE